MPSRIALVPVVLIPIVITSIISNSRKLQLTNNIDELDDSPYYFPQGEEINNHADNFVALPNNKAAVDISKRRAMSSSHDAHDDYIGDGKDCFRARSDTVHPSLYTKLPKPYINLGFPKMGTSSLHSFFKCGGHTSTHFNCGQRKGKCASCIRESVASGLSPLALCGEADMYAQIDDGTYFPQIELLEELVHGHTNATFFLTFRSMEKWYHSMTHWPPRKNGPHMSDRIMTHNITGSPTVEGGGTPEQFYEWYCKHVQRVRNVIRHSSNTLVEVDIEDPDTAQRMEDIFGIVKSCWGHTNANALIHPDLNADVKMSKFFTKQGNDIGTEDKSDTDDDGDDDDSGNVEEEESLWGLEDDDSVQNGRNDGDGSNDSDDASIISNDVGDEDQSYFNQDCFRARTDAFPSSSYHNLPFPYINLGFPKMGTSSLYSFFKCGGLESTHYRCGRRIGKCSICTQESVAAGLPPLAQCGNANVFAQLDNGQYFPQIELLEELVHGHPNATFFLTFRSMDKWYNSLKNWPPRKRGPHMPRRFTTLDITGLPKGKGKNLYELSDWYCKHVERVRDLIAKNPSHTLVEVDIEDPDTAQRMEDIFGIEQSCWGHKNANGLILDNLNISQIEFNKHQAIMKEESMSPARKERRAKNKNNMRALGDV